MRIRAKRYIYENSRNPIFPWGINIPDCEAHIGIHGDLMIIGSTDKYKKSYCSNTYHFVRTNDMYKWEIALNVFSYQKERIYAPDFLVNDKHLVLFFCTASGEEHVAIFDSNYRMLSNHQLNCKGIDPAVLKDDDGTIYFYWGQFQASVAKLNQNYEIEEETVKNNILTEKEHGFHEGISVRKINNTYYALYTMMKKGRPTVLAYATANEPMGPFSYQGIIVDNLFCDPCTWNNHGSIQEYCGKWYVFYHRSYNCSPYLRHLCIEQIEIDQHGRIDRVNMSSQGVGGPFTSGEEIYAWNVCEIHGNAYLKKKAFSVVLCNIRKGDKLVFRYIENEQEGISLIFTCKGSALIEIEVDGRKICETKISFKNNTANVRIECKTHEISFRIMECSRFVLKSIHFNSIKGS